jgi:hypothetical protein
LCCHSLTMSVCPSAFYQESFTHFLDFSATIRTLRSRPPRTRARDGTAHLTFVLRLFTSSSASRSNTIVTRLLPPAVPSFLGQLVVSASPPAWSDSGLPSPSFPHIFGACGVDSHPRAPECANLGYTYLRLIVFPPDTLPSTCRTTYLGIWRTSSRSSAF